MKPWAAVVLFAHSMLGDPAVQISYSGKHATLECTGTSCTLSRNADIYTSIHQDSCPNSCAPSQGLCSPATVLVKQKYGTCTGPGWDNSDNGELLLNMTASAPTSNCKHTPGDTDFLLYLSYVGCVAEVSLTSAADNTTLWVEDRSEVGTPPDYLADIECPGIETATLRDTVSCKAVSTVLQNDVVHISFFSSTKQSLIFDPVLSNGTVAVDNWAPATDSYIVYFNYTISSDVSTPLYLAYDFVQLSGGSRHDPVIAQLSQKPPSLPKLPATASSWLSCDDSSTAVISCRINFRDSHGPVQPYTDGVKAWATSKDCAIAGLQVSNVSVGQYNELLFTVTRSDSCFVYEIDLDVGASIDNATIKNGPSGTNSVLNLHLANHPVSSSMEGMGRVGLATCTSFSNGTTTGSCAVSRTQEFMGNLSFSWCSCASCKDPTSFLAQQLKGNCGWGLLTIQRVPTRRHCSGDTDFAFDLDYSNCIAQLTVVTEYDKVVFTDYASSPEPATGLAITCNNTDAFIPMRSVIRCSATPITGDPAENYFSFFNRVPAEPQRVVFSSASTGSILEERWTPEEWGHTFDFTFKVTSEFTTSNVELKYQVESQKTGSWEPVGSQAAFSLSRNPPVLPKLPPTGASRLECTYLNPNVKCYVETRDALGAVLATTDGLHVTFSTDNGCNGVEVMPTNTINVTTVEFVLTVLGRCYVDGAQLQVSATYDQKLVTNAPFNVQTVSHPAVFSYQGVDCVPGQSGCDLERDAQYKGGFHLDSCVGPCAAAQGLCTPAVVEATQLLGDCGFGEASRQLEMQTITDAMDCHAMYDYTLSLLYTGCWAKVTITDEQSNFTMSFIDRASNGQPATFLHVKCTPDQPELRSTLTCTANPLNQVGGRQHFTFFDPATERVVFQNATGGQVVPGNWFPQGTMSYVFNFNYTVQTELTTYLFLDYVIEKQNNAGEWVTRSKQNVVLATSPRVPSLDPTANSILSCKTYNENVECIVQLRDAVGPVAKMTGLAATFIVEGCPKADMDMANATLVAGKQAQAVIIITRTKSCWGAYADEISVKVFATINDIPIVSSPASLQNLPGQATPAPKPTESPQAPQGKKKEMPVTVLAIFGSLFGLLVVVLVGYYIYRHKKESEKKVGTFCVLGEGINGGQSSFVSPLLEEGPTTQMTNYPVNDDNDDEESVHLAE